MTEFSLVKAVHHDIYAFISPAHALKGAAKGRSVLITGAGTGIGKATAEAFAQASAKRVLLVGRRLDVVAAARDELRKKYPDCEIYAESCDVTKAEDVAKVFAICKEHNTEIDVLVNNAGFALGMGPVKDSVPVDWWKTFEINVQGPYHMTQAFLKQHTPGKPAAIISTSSTASYHQYPVISAYSASKVALNRIVEWFASENKDDGVQAFALHPGGVAGTEMTASAPDYMQAMFTEKPQLAAGTAVYLSTARAAYLSGRYVDALWDLEELEGHKARIKKEDLLKMSLLGDAR